MVVDYKARKNEVLDSYEKAEKLVAELDKNAKESGIPSPVEQICGGSRRMLPSWERIQKMAERIRDDHFSLLVAGESNSGKSTFINAYLGLGEELLPVDTLQCTSAIIKIKYGKECCARATYADGRKETITDGTDIRIFLKERASVQEEYRNIPVSLINNEILIKAGQKAKKQQVKIDEEDINNLLKASEVQEANIHHLPNDEYERRIREYIKHEQNNWYNIVTEIEVFFPFTDESFRGIELIDSPGLYARGGLSGITSDYIENADAIMFLKPVVGAALVAQQFNHFFESESAKRNKNAIFVVLTHTAMKTEKELKDLKKEAYEVFGMLDKDHILFVDSKAEFYANCYAPLTDEERMKQMQALNQEKKLDDFVINAYRNAQEGDIFNSEKKEFISALRGLSGFQKIKDSLDRFGRQAHYGRFIDLLEAMEELYKRFMGDLETQEKLVRTSVEDPAKLDRDIRELKKDLEELQLKIRKGVDEIAERFQGNEGVIHRRTGMAVSEFKNHVSRIDANSDDAFYKLEQAAKKKMYDLIDFKREIKKDFIKECNEKLVELNDSKIPSDSVKPDIDGIVGGIRNEIEREKEEKVPQNTGWLCFEKTSTKPKYSTSYLFQKMERDILTRLNEIKADSVKELMDFVDTLRSAYLGELEKGFTSKANELGQIQEQKATAEEKLRFVECLKELRNKITEMISETVRIRGGIQECTVKQSKHR